MQKTLFTKQPRLLSVSLRLGLSLALGILTVLLSIGLTPVAAPALAPAVPSSPGALDPTFGNDGIVTTTIGPDSDFAYDVALQPDGKIVVAGSANDGTDYDFALARYTVSGNLDTSFGSGGSVITPIGTEDDWARGIALQPDGKIVMAGWADSGTDDDLALVRYTVSGELDTTFGGGGIVTTPTGPGRDRAYGVALQPDGKIVAAGDSHHDGRYEFVVVRYTVSGDLDTGFGNSGVVTTSVSTGNSHAYSVAIQPDGKIVVAGGARYGGNDGFALARYTVSGDLDTTFGSGGVVNTSIGSANAQARDVTLQQDGKIVVAGRANNGSDDDFAVARYTVSGDLDPTFGSGGTVTTPIGLARDRALSVALQPGGKIVTVGFTNNGSSYDFAMVRYTASGDLDTTFGSNGTVTTPIGDDGSYAAAVAPQPAGKIVAAGYAYNGTDYDFALARYHAGYAVYLPLVLR